MTNSRKKIKEIMYTNKDKWNEKKMFTAQPTMAYVNAGNVTREDSRRTKQFK